MSDRNGKSYRVGVIGFAHMHVNELVDRFIASGRAQIVACADTRPLTPSVTTVEGSRQANMTRTLAAPGGPRAYDDYQKMLETEKLDIAIFCPENRRHADVAEAIAQHGVHMLTEKPMAAGLHDALRMKAAAEKAKVALAVNWPITWHPAYRRLKEMVDAGAVGDVWELKWRNPASLGPLAHGSTHPGATVISGQVSNAEKAKEWWHQAAAGGGALLDYCCYGACLASWLLPPPVSVQCFKANLMSAGDADDNAAMLVRFPSAMAILEASWTTFHNGVPNGPIVYGTKGTIVLDGADILVYGERGAKTPSLVEKGEPLPAGRATIAEEFLHHIETGEPLHPTLAYPINLAAMAILDAGIKSAQKGSAEPVARI
ncbi:MAG TPA: Gfo/Idh/MocA family oxidoreductase [Roseiarcus sp.]|nr:Gfo/Idh/MocA family oxidoreductase [Roseiarcus sp.]